MADVARPGFRAGWELDDPSNSSSIVKAKLPQLQSGASNSTDVEIVANLATGNFDVYEKRFIGPRPEIPLFSYNASNDKVTPRATEAYNAYYSSPQGKQQLEQLLRTTKLATYNNAQILTGTDPTRNSDFQNLKNKAGYRSISNATIPGQRSPDPNAQSSDTSVVGAGATPGTPVGTPEQLRKGVPFADNTRFEYENLRYPLELNLQSQDHIIFNMISYQPKNINTNIQNQLKTGFAGDLFFKSKSTEAGNTKNTKGSVTLPIQPSISDSNAVSWNDQGLNAVLGNVAALASGLTDPSAANGLTQTVSENEKQENYDAIKRAIGSYFSGQAAGGEGQQLFTRVTGAIINPNLELLFNGPTIRSFNFSFSMSAREPNEAIQIKKIIRFFKQGMSVKRSSNSLFLKSPHIFEIKYIYGKSDGGIHPWLNTFKECALTSCSVNYTPSGSYATYVDGSMTQYDLSLTFTELEPIYDDDYAKLVPGGNSDTHIGF